MNRASHFAVVYVAVFTLSGCYADVTRRVRRQFASDYGCRDFEVSDRQALAGEGMGTGYYVAEGCGRRVEYTCETTDGPAFSLEPGPRRRDTFCRERALSAPRVAQTATRARTSEPRSGAQHVTDAEHGVTYVGLALRAAWWELRFIAPEENGALTGEAVIVLRAATESSRLQRCGELSVITESATLRFPAAGESVEGRVAQYRTTVTELRNVATADRVRFEACNVVHDLAESERSDLRQFVLMATPAN